MIKTEIDLKSRLDTLALKYDTKEFIKDDPVQFIHLFKNPRDIEIAGFLAALFAFGKREVFIKKLNSLFNLMEMAPFSYIENKEYKKGLKGLNYRFIKENDLTEFFKCLNKMYFEDKISLEELFDTGYRNSKDVFCALQYVCDYFYTPVSMPSQGYKFMLSNPNNKGAMKRMNMFLRWMVRKSPVDIGIWTFMNKNKLFIPLDVHVGNISRSLGLLQRNQNDYKAVVQLTEKLKEFDEKDPVKYDFALFGYGVNLKNEENV